MKVRGALERHLEAKLELRIASEWSMAVQLGAKVPLGGPNWQHKSNLEPNLAPKYAF